MGLVPHVMLHYQEESQMVKTIVIFPVNQMSIFIGILHVIVPAHPLSYQNLKGLKLDISVNILAHHSNIYSGTVPA